MSLFAIPPNMKNSPPFPPVSSVLAAFLLCLSPLNAVEPAQEPRMGVWLTHGNETLIDAYDAWTNQGNQPIVEFGPMDNWEALTGVTPGYGLAWSVNQWATAYRSRVLWSIPMLPQSGASLSTGAAGSYDHHWRAVATTLINAGYGSCTVRLGWEFNGSWYPWHTNTSAEAANYKAYWKKIVLAMRSVAGANFRFNWCGAVGDQPSGINPSLAYPEDDAGGSYVDEIGVDFYDVLFGNGTATYPLATGDAQWLIDTKRRNSWNSVVIYGTYHLTWWKDFAISKNKPFTFPEWGLANRQPYDSTNYGLSETSFPSGYGGGDNPDFVQRMHEWIVNPANNVSWHAYFQEDNSQIKSKIFQDPSFPVASAKFLDLFGGQKIFTVFQNPVNRIAWTGGYGTRTGAVVATDGTHKPFEGADQYKITYTSTAGFQLAFSEKNLAQATHLRLARKGPIANSTQYFGIRLTASDGTYGAFYSIPRTTTYARSDIPLTMLTAGLNVGRVNSIYIYPMPSTPTGVSDTIYLDSITFIKKTP